MLNLRQGRRWVNVFPVSATMVIDKNNEWRTMPKYLISFPSKAMSVPDEELAAVGAAANAVTEEAIAAGVYVFACGIEDKVDPVLVSADGSVSSEIYPGSEITGGFTILDLPDRQAAEEWARKFAVACRCSQELREVA